MKSHATKAIQKRTWYGLYATVIIGPGFIHKAGLGSLLIPHPPMINWLLRQGLAEKERLVLSCTHEIGHLESVPLAALYTAANLAASFTTGTANFITLILVLIGTHAAWEIMSETFTITSGRQLYRKCYEKVSVIPRTVFWIVTGGLALMGWLIVIF